MAAMGIPPEAGGPLRIMIDDIKETSQATRPEVVAKPTPPTKPVEVLLTKPVAKSVDVLSPPVASASETVEPTKDVLEPIAPVPQPIAQEPTKQAEEPEKDPFLLVLENTAKVKEAELRKSRCVYAISPSNVQAPLYFLPDDEYNSSVEFTEGKCNGRRSATHEYRGLARRAKAAFTPAQHSSDLTPS